MRLAIVLLLAVVAQALETAENDAPVRMFAVTTS